MFPKLFEIPWVGWPINSYGFCIMVGFLLASWIAVRRGKPLGYDSDFILDVGIISMIFGILGAKVNYLLQYPQDLMDPSQKPGLFSDPAMNPLGALILGPLPYVFWWWRVSMPRKMKGSADAPVEKKAPGPLHLFTWQNAVLLFFTLLLSLIGTRGLHLWLHKEDYSWLLFKNWQSGFVLYGGLVAGVLSGSLYCRMRGESIARFADLAAAPIMLALAFGRFGCFMNGCCFGQRGEGFPCIQFPAGSPAAQEHRRFGEPSWPVHPTQLYETLATVGFFFLLSWIWKKKRKAEGGVFLVMMMLYGGWRFLIEFARGDKRPEWIGSLSYSQVMSMGALALAAVWLFFLRRRSPGSGETPGLASAAPQAPAPAK